MKTSFWAIVTAAGLASVVVVAACDPNPPRKIAAGTGGTGVSAGTGGVVGSGGGGGTGGITPGTGGAMPGTGGEASGTGGEALGTGGATAASGGEAMGGNNGDGSGGGGATAAHAGAGGHAASSGGASGGGTGGMMGGGGAAGPDDVIDDFEDNDGRIGMLGGRQGPWHSFAESGCSNQQPPSTAFTPRMGGANSTKYAAHSSGSGCGMFGGIGFDLNNATTTPEAMQSQAYNASGYRGISFWAKGNGNLRVEFAQKAFVPTDKGGSCTADCWRVYGSRKVQGMLSMSDWKQFTILFSELEREDASKTPAFDPTTLMGIAFKHEGAMFDFWIDEIQFVK